MKTDIRHIIGMFFIIVLGWSCKEPYIPDEINSSEKIPVIQGLILENKSPTVTLSWALKYKDKTPEYISGANVSVMDDMGNQVNLQEDYPGSYSVPDDEFRGVVGRTYTLEVELPDGNIYASNAEFLPMAPLIDSLYANPESRTVYWYNSLNEPIAEVQQGLNILTDVSGNAGDVIYYRFNTKVMKQMYRIMKMTAKLPQRPYSQFIWEVSTLDNAYSVDFSVNQNNRQILSRHSAGFLRYFYDNSLEDWYVPYFGPKVLENTAPITSAWVVSITVYSISGEAYNYYNSIARQLDANNELFATVPSQVKSNIRCITNPDNKVIGIFEASSTTLIQKAFGWWNMDSYNVKNLPTFPYDFVSGTKDNSPPEFWINF